MVVLSANPLAQKPADLRSLKAEGLLLAGGPYVAGQGRASVIARGLVSGRKI